MDAKVVAKINVLLSSDDSVASLPELYFEFKKVVDDPESTFDEIGDVIRKDPGLSARLLKVVNSVFFYFSEKIETISHAVNMIGLQRLSDLVVSTLIIDKFKRLPVQLVSMRSFWEHSIATGLAAKHLASILNESNPERFFLAGLLHDIGRPFLCIKMPAQMRAAIMLSVAESMDINEAENRILGFNHCDAGSLLLRRWNLPEVYCSVTASHHELGKAKTFIRENGLVHLADHIASNTLYGCNGEPFISSLDDNALDLVGMSKEEVESELLKFLSETFNEVAQSLLQVA
ncbi:MAG: HDOD domain-containing protein [Nitrospinae bacterium]|nr:HDOD domain-containing protein [Nitrospinota bacterium]